MVQSPVVLYIYIYYSLNCPHILSSIPMKLQLLCWCTDAKGILFLNLVNITIFMSAIYVESEISQGVCVHMVGVIVLAM